MKDTIDNVYPSHVRVHYNLIETEGKYIVSLIITGYPSKTGFLEVVDAIPRDLENRYSIYVYKQDEIKVLKDLTSVIATTASEKKTVNNNQIDMALLENIANEAKELRRKIQIDNEGVYRVCIYICVWDYIKEKALQKARTIQNRLYSKGISTKIGNFRQKDLYMASLPLKDVENYLMLSTYKTVTTTMLSYIFPYYNRYIMEKGGVQFGISEKNICIIDVFSKNCTNANMLVLGSSGSGKSYFVNILVIRGAINGILQRVIDPEGEYVCLANMLGGKVVSDDINLMYFSEGFVRNNKEGYIEKNINKIKDILKLSEILTSIERDVLIQAMKVAYKEKNITEKEETLYRKKDIEGTFVSKEYVDYSEFPNMEDALKKIVNAKVKASVRSKIEEVICQTTIKSRQIINKNNIIIYNLKEIPERKREMYIQIYLNSIRAEYGDKLQVYIDELWKCIGYGRSDKIIHEVTDMFKSIRKQNAGIVVVTQEISDLFKYENGAFAKSILNNSYFKAYFKMEYADIETLRKMGVSGERELDKLKKINKGTAVITRGWTTFCLDIIADENERRYMEKGDG